MNLKILSLYIFVLLHQLSIAQTEKTCATDVPSEDFYKSLPWFGNEDFLKNYYDSIRIADNSKSNKTIENVSFRVPVQLWVYTMQDGSAGGNYRLPRMLDFQNIIDKMNNDFRASGAPIRFYLLENIKYIRNGTLIVMNKITANINGGIYHTINALNVHIIDRISGVEASAFTFTRNDIKRWIFVERHLYTGDVANNSLATYSHETGHYFDLLHTFENTEHQYPCLQEPVTRGKKWNVCNPGIFPVYNRRCLFTGDLLCDTEADPNMSDHGSINPVSLEWECSGSAYCIDQYGETYHPDIHNMMAYGNRQYRTQFSPGQVAVMEYRAQYMGYNLNHTKFDIFEPDDNIDMPRDFDYREGVVHYRTFHNRALLNSVRDEDWYRFTVAEGEQSGILEIFTESSGEFADADTELRLYRGNEEIAYNDNTGSTGFSNLRTNSLPEGEYFVRVTYKNVNIGQTFSYKITIQQCVKGDYCIDSRVVNPGETFTAEAFGTVSTACTDVFNIKQSGTANFKSSEIIHLTDGFHAQYGSNFRAQITELECNDKSNKSIPQVYEIPKIERYFEINSADYEEQDICKETHFNISPNPGAGRFILDFENDNFPQKCEILDLTGNVLQTFVIGQIQTEIDLSNQPSGIYLLKITSNGKTVTKKIVLQKE